VSRPALTPAAIRAAVYSAAGGNQIAVRTSRAGAGAYRVSIPDSHTAGYLNLTGPGSSPGRAGKALSRWLGLTVSVGDIERAKGRDMKRVIFTVREAS
jgi:hypothetical protein